MQIDLPLLRQSERTCFRRCTQRWWWGYREGLVLRKPDSGAAWFGTGLHVCLAEWYIPGTKRGRPLLETWEQYTKDSYESIRVYPDFGDDEAATYEDAVILGREMLEMYEERYGLDDQFEVIAPEQRFRVLIPDPANPKRAIAENVGTFDAVIRDHSDGRIKMVDHKSCRYFAFKHLTLDDQGGSYCALSTHALRQQGLIGPKEAVSGMIYNFLRKARRDTRPENAEGLKLNKPEKKHYAAALTEYVSDTFQSEKAYTGFMKMTLPALKAEADKIDLVVGGDVSKVQPSPIFYRHFVERTAKERNRQIVRIGQEVQIMNMVRQGLIPITKNPTEACANMCDFFDLCELDETSGDTEDMKSMMYSVRDPYADHREGAENSKTSVSADTRRKVPRG